MKNCKVLLVLSVAVLVILLADNGVNAAPEPCSFFDHHMHRQTSTEAPKPASEGNKEPREPKQNKMKKLEKLMQEWLSWGQRNAPAPAAEMQEPHYQSSGLDLQNFFSYYLQFIAYILSNTFGQ